MRAARAELAVALGVAALGVFLLIGTSEISAGAGYDRVGPRFFPYAVAVGLMLLGASLAGSAWRDRPASRTAAAHHRGAVRTNWSPLGYLGLSFVLFLALLERAGFVIAASVQFWLVARAFHSERPFRDAAAAVLLAATVFLLFARGLGMSLPLGVLERVF